MVLYLLDIAPVFLGGYYLADVFLADVLRKFLCPADLVVLFVLAEAYGEGLVNICNGSHIAGVSAAGKEASHLNVGYNVSLNRVLAGLGNALYPCIHVGTFVSVEVNVPVALYIKLAVFILEEMCGRKLIYVLEKCFVGGGVLECKIVFQRRSVQLLDELGVNKERLYL